MKYFENIKNNIDFFIREHLNFSRKNYTETPEDKVGLFASQKALEKEKTLFEKYDLAFLKTNTTRLNYLENLYVLDILDQNIKIEQKNNLKILDLGCKNWAYAKGEYFFFKKYSPQITLDGIELDTNRLYTNFYSRGEVAKFNKKPLECTNYIKGDFLNHNEKYDFILWFLPFIFENPHLKWGLPFKYFQPQKMLAHAFQSLNPDGEILIVNQGEVEFEAQKKLCEELKISYSELGELKNEFLSFPHKMFGIKIKN